MNFLWLLIVHYLMCSSSMAFSDNDRCLNDIPEVMPKKYFHLKGMSLPIRLETSSRITHQLSTQVFYIFIKEVLGYAKIEVNLNEDDFNIETVMTRLSDYSNAKVTEPPATINLEVWVPPDYEPATELIKECGILAPPGRFGWFIPTELNGPIKQYYDKYNAWTENIHEIHWSFFTDRKLVWSFDIDDSTMTNFIEGNEYNRVAVGASEYFCNNASICNNGMYTPKQCVHQNCAVLLAPHFNSTEFLIDHINELNLYVKVLWVGHNLKKVVEELTTMYTLQRSNRSVLFFYWYPSDIIIDENNFIGVTFKNNELLNFTHNEKVGYKYEMHRLVKLAWGKIEENAEPLFNGLRSFKLTSADIFFLLKQRELHPAKSLREVACDWMRQNHNTWWWWKKDTQTVIYIGGIFPVEAASSYNGRGIIKGAMLAQSAVNRNTSILPDYHLQLIATDGMCKADNVMKSFIDFIVEGYYKRLVGVLGPGCSETVEPLAGVSKHYHTIVISYSAEGASFSDRKKYPYFFRTIGENQHYKHVYLYLFKYFGWKRVAALTEDGQKYTEYISSMQDDLEKNNISFIANKKFPRERETEAMTRYLKDLKSKRARIIIADVVDDVARAVMCEAYRLEMTATQGYVWFLPMWLNSTWYDTDYFNQNKKEIVNCTTKEMIKASTGYFAMTHAFFAPDTAIMQENMSVRRWRRNYEKITPVPSDYAGFAYDAVWTYALALDKLSRTDSEALADLHSESSTNKLVRLVEKTDFNGVSGRIKFRGGPSRFSVINIMQWYDRSMHTIGHFNPNLTDDKPEIFGGALQIDDSAVKWFTANGKIPEDGTLPPTPCAVEGLARAFDVECQTAVIILNVIVALVLVLIVIAACLYMKRRYEQKVELTAKYMRALGLPFNLNTKDLDKWEISRESVVINRKLGEGAFGTVYGGEANLPDSGWSAVAVKTLKVGSTTEEKLDFLSEAEVMKRFDHKNIVKLLGVCTKDEPVYTVMEFMLYGDLKTFLLARRHLVRKNADDNDEVSAKRLTSMGLDVARALSYLASMKYVHRDVASRNCLVNAQRCVKLGDFGMTRAMFDNDYYKFTRKGMLPVRWMSPESLQLGVFKPSSDVWSFAVLLYEIVTFGSFPFQGKSNAEVLELVKNGHTLDIPKGAKPQLEGLMKSCWNRDSNRRPEASEIVAFLATNPRLLAPCLDVPLASVQPEDNEQLDLSAIKIPEIRITTKESPSAKSTSGGLESPPEYRRFEVSKTPEGFEAIPLEESPKQPLLGTRTSPERKLLESSPEEPLLRISSSPDREHLDESSPKEPLLGARSSPQRQHLDEYHDEDEQVPLRDVKGDTNE